MSTLEIVLSIEQVGDRYRVSVVESPVGEVQATIDRPFTREEVQAIRDVLSGTAAAAGLSAVERQAAARQFGEKLFQAVFRASPEVYAAYLTSLDRSHGRGVRIKLFLEEAGDLRDAPWELLRDPRQDFLALSGKTAVIRYPRMLSVRPRVEVRGPLRVLVMVSSPRNLPPVDVQAQWGALLEATASLRERGAVMLDLLEDATLRTLQRRLRSQEYHVFHYIGHGEYDEASQRGALVFEDPRGEERGYAVYGEELARELSEENLIRLVILTACEGGRSTGGDPFSGVASSVVARGIPAVVAMQFPITDRAAQLFSEEFYRAVVEGLNLDVAVSEARRTLLNTLRSTEWATPVLYMRAPGEPLFDLTDQGKAQPEPATAAPPPARTTPWRVVGGVVAAILLVAMLLWGGAALFRQVSPGPSPTPTLRPTVTPRPNTFPDLVIDSFRTSPSEPAPGKPFTLFVRIRNVGTAPAGPFNVAWLPSATASALVARAASELPGLPPGGILAVPFTYTYGWWGTYSTVATIDVDGEVVENNERGDAERNNFMAFQIVMSDEGFQIDFSQRPGGELVDQSLMLNGDEFSEWGFRIVPLTAAQQSDCQTARPRLEVAGNRVSLMVGLEADPHACANVPLALVFDRAVGAVEVAYTASAEAEHGVAIFSDSAGGQEISRAQVVLAAEQEALLRLPESDRTLIRRAEFYTGAAPLRIDHITLWPH